VAFALQIRNNASQDRLEKLIEARLQPGADKESIDRRIWDLFGKEWAIMYTDLAGFSRQVAEFGIIHFLQTIYGTFQIPVDSLLTQTQRYARFRQTNCSLLLPSRERCRFLGKIQKSGVRNSMTYRLQNSRKSNFATEP